MDLDESLLLQSQVAQMKEPDTRPLTPYRDFLNGTALLSKGAETMPLISGRAKEFLEDTSDLLNLNKPLNDDYFSRFLQNHWIFRKRETTDPLDRITIHKNSHVVRTAAAVGLVLAAVLLIGAVVNLYVVPSPRVKLGLVTMYTTLFAASVTLCTDTRIAEVFAATAAYAAVLVVFVSGDFGRTKSKQCLIQPKGSILQTSRCPNLIIT
jgi:hypothetical protein